MLVTLTTDFGTRDGYVAAMKGAILSVDPAIRLVDVAHGVAAQDVMEGAFVLRRTIPSFPTGTVHLAVIDPGVGSSRKSIAARLRLDHGHAFFVGPDNGLLSLVAPDGPLEVVELDKPHAWRVPTPSRTFHGRDIFAPVAAHLAAGATLADLGSPVTGVQSLRWPLPREDDEGIEGWIVHVDHFGNCITNIPASSIHALREGRSIKVYAGTTLIRGLRDTYSAVPASDPLAVISSDGLLEITVNRGDASALLSLDRGDPIRLLFEAAPVLAKAGSPA